MKKRGTEISFGRKIKSLVIAAAIMALGLLLLKFAPMGIWGNDILFDASMHLTITIFVLYVLWYFIDQNRGWRIPFFIFSLVVIAIVSLQRIVAGAHDDVGLLLGLAISVFAIIVSKWNYFAKRLSF
jgi:hypothetical protein